MNRIFQCYRVVGGLSVVAAWILLCSFAGAGDWARFHGPDGAGVGRGQVPIEWSDDHNLKWKLKMPGRGFSSPIVVGDLVFVTCYSDADDDLANLKRHLLCVRREDGKPVWEKIVPSAAAEVRSPSFGVSHGFASHTPTSDGENVFVMFGNTGVVAFDLKGNQLWQKSVGQESASMFGSASSPILYGDSLIVMAGAESESIRAFDKKTGEELWKTEAETLSRSYSTPLIAKNGEGRDELLISAPYEMWGLNPETGKLNWYAENQIDMNAVPSPIVKDGICYVIGGRSGGRAAIRLGGKGDVTETHLLWSTSVGSYVSSPVLHDGHLYWCNDRGIAYCVDAKTGQEITKKRLDGAFYASVVLVGDKLYAVSRRDGTFVIEATPQLKQLAHNRLSDESEFRATPALSDGQLILRSDQALYCIETN
jgi:outer membrane protein assembly factor BamB